MLLLFSFSVFTSSWYLLKYKLSKANSPGENSPGLAYRIRVLRMTPAAGSMGLVPWAFHRTFHESKLRQSKEYTFWIRKIVSPFLLNFLKGFNLRDGQTHNASLILYISIYRDMLGCRGWLYTWFTLGLWRTRDSSWIWVVHASWKCVSCFSISWLCDLVCCVGHVCTFLLFRTTLPLWSLLNPQRRDRC